MTDLAVRVYFEDTDFSGRVYHGAFVRYLERARTETLRSVGVDHKTLASAATPRFFTIRALNLTFHGPAFIDDLLTVTAEPRGGGRATFVFGQSVRRGADVLVRADVELCLIDSAGRPSRPPPEIADLLRSA